MSEEPTSEPLPGYTIWDNHPEHPVEDWMSEVSNDYTRLGYWEWVKHRIEAEEGDK